MSAQNLKASDIVYDFIVEKINQGVWTSNTKIWTETELSKELQVSRVAVREAVQKLSAMSILRKIQGSGTYVEDISINTLAENLTPIVALSDEDFLSIMEFRIHFECGNISLFINRCTDDEIRQLEKNYIRMVESKESLEEFHKADYEFHNIIAGGTRNSFVSQISQLCGNVLIAQHKRISYSIGTAVGIEDHAVILKYIKERDEQLASIHMQRHINRIISVVSQVVKK
ncbi:MAG: FadR family transcriptional regulator [Defluviitaleaceae bacterium]|nr:FadR family transcriptional regulator [Defluviitaleaceae bacterium]